ncbi:MAG: SIR2 family protein, partial [Nitrospirales bacterium]
MRFFADGPSIPDNLLNARDEGRVVFFCGAGVSRAFAGLSDFFGLAQAVVDSLGVSPESTVRKLLSESQSIHQRIGIDGLISADRIFGLLERDFATRDIEKAVAQALKPSEMVNLSAHQILLDLAKTPEGKMRLVTTNFDRLFEACDGSLRVWQPPRLPTPSRHAEMDGIIHLHGCVDTDYTGSQGDGFVLSSSEFGHAYLADGWATEFIRQILNRYVVVFVGYTADDPPVQYLLEALNRQSGILEGVYAFQFGIENEASAKWKHKGVRAISYNEANSHEALWKTLEAWAGRARDPEEWHKAVIEMARNGPEQLQPHERGQVAHIVSTLEGMRKFSSAEVLPPAEWLCVFDPYQRFEKPGNQWEGPQKGCFVDPFDIYGLDSDQVPQKIDPDDPYTEREVPHDSWDCFATNLVDQKNLREQNFPAFRGRWAQNGPGLPARLQQLGVWMSKISDQPASVWWAVKQTGLHPNIQKQIQFELNRPSQGSFPIVHKAWEYLFETYKEERGEFKDDWYDLRDSIRTDGWNLAVIRKYAIINCPFLRVKRDYLRRLKPPESRDDIRLTDLINLEVAYPEEGRDESIPEEWLEPIIREFRKGLEAALFLETELSRYSGLGSYKLRRISPIAPDIHPTIDSHSRTHGLSGYVIFFSSLFERLIQHNPIAARKEFAAWPVEDDTIFARLRIWASRYDQLLSAKDFGHVITSFNDDVFWDSHHQRDLLLVLAKRWRELEESTQKSIEDRLLRGRKKWEGEEDSDFIKRRSLVTLNRISWMKENGCNFTFDFDSTVLT